MEEEADETRSIRVVADDRERGSPVVGALESNPDVLLELKRLKLGDYLVDNRLLVERKTVADFAISLCDGRLFHQAKRLATHLQHRVCFVLEGTTGDLSRIDVSRQALQGAMITLTLVFGLPVLRARDGEETARLMLYASRQLTRRARGDSRRVGYKPGSKRRIQLRMLQAIPHVGPKKARSLLDTFGTLDAILTASTDDVAAVPLIGDKTAERIKWALSEPTPSAYSDDDLVL
jgi:ERCC4-type nuclease